MTAKEYLSQIKYLQSMIRNLEDEIKALQTERFTIRSAWPDGQPHGTGITDPVGEQAAKLADEISKAEDGLVKWRAELLRKELEVIRTIGRVTNEDQNRLLFLRYVMGARWEQIAVDLGYSYQWVAGPLHGEALKKIEEILSG